MKRLSLWLLLVLFCSAAGLWAPGTRHHAAADNSTPSSVPATIVGTPTGSPVTVTPGSIELPTVTRERSTPLAIVEGFPTAGPTQPSLSTATAVTETVPTPTPTPLALNTGATTPSTGWPTPAQLRQNARLRWGKGIPGTVRRWAFLIVPAARRFQLDPDLVAAVMTMESNGDPLALSPAGARGLMQILDGPWDPATNVDTGARMLRNLYDEFGDWGLALAGYNAGPAAVTTYGGVPPYRETRDYVIVVGYLWDLYGHRHLTFARRQQYRTTLRDLAQFSDQRRKIRKLARIAHVAVPAPGPSCSPRACGQLDQQSSATPVDPFWPMGGSPDPLQQVGPFLSSP